MYHDSNTQDCYASDVGSNKSGPSQVTEKTFIMHQKISNSNTWCSFSSKIPERIRFESF